MWDYRWRKKRAHRNEEGDYFRSDRLARGKDKPRHDGKGDQPHRDRRPQNGIGAGKEMIAGQHANQFTTRTNPNY